VVTSLSNSMLVQVVLPIDEEWQEFLNTISHDFYHLPGYVELEASRQNATAEAVIIKNGEESFFLAYLVRDCCQVSNLYELESDRVYDVISPYGYPGMLVSQSGQNPQFIKQCLTLIYDYWRSKNICSAFIRLHPIINSYIDTTIESYNQFVVWNQGSVVICDLTKDSELLWKEIRATYRNEINKLRRSGFNVKIVAVAAYLDIFIDIYQETMDRVNANNAYYFNRDYFENLVCVLGDRLKMCIVEIDGEIAAASLVTELCGIVQYYLSGTRTKFSRQSPAKLMVYHMIEWAKSRNNRYLNLGGGLGGNQDSLYHFKAGFSNQSQPFTTMKIIVNDNTYNSLTHFRAKSLGIAISEIETKSFFPIYRYQLN
jgi:Acetyltransferase (GNAT) domain